MGLISDAGRRPSLSELQKYYDMEDKTHSTKLTRSAPDTLVPKEAKHLELTHFFFCKNCTRSNIAWHTLFVHKLPSSWLPQKKYLFLHLILDLYFCSLRKRNN